MSGNSEWNRQVARRTAAKPRPASKQRRAARVFEAAEGPLPRRQRQIPIGAILTEAACLSAWSAFDAGSQLV